MSSPSFHRYRPLFPGGEWSAFLDALARPEPRSFRVRTGRITPGALVDRLQAQGFRVAPHSELPGVFRVEREPFSLSETLEHWLGLFYIQQASTTVVAPLLGPRPGEGVVDLCAAPGGKTAHLAELMEDRGCLLANDLSEKRVQALAGNLARLAHPGVITLVGDALRFPESAPVHRVLLDVPCSGEGRARREGPDRDGAFVEASEGDLKRLPRLQEALLRKALRMVVPGGRVLYVTCTLAPEENEGVVDAVLRSPAEGPGGSPPARLIPLRPDLPHAPGLTSFGEDRYLPELEGSCRIHPHHLDSGGLFLALLEREGPAGGGAPREGADGVDADRPLPGLLELPGWTRPGTHLPGERAAEPPPGAKGGRGRRGEGRGAERGRARHGGPGQGGAPGAGPGERPGTRSSTGAGTARDQGSRSGPGRGGRAQLQAEAGPALLRSLLATEAPDPAEVAWLARGGALRFHTLLAWPLQGWAEEGERVRIMTAGLRGAEGGRKGAPRPSGDLLRWIGRRLDPGVGVELDTGTWLRLLEGAAVRTHGHTRQGASRGHHRSTVLLHQGVPLGTARLQGDRLQHELPPARARWLHQVLRRSQVAAVDAGDSLAEGLASGRHDERDNG